MRILHKTDRKINIVGIDDHELTGLDVVTAADLFDSQKRPVIGIFHEYVHFGMEGLFMLLDKWNGSTAKLMTDPRLLKVPRELQHLMDICFHFPLNLAWFVCIPSWFLLMMTFSNIPITSAETWDASVLDHGIIAALLEEIHQEDDDEFGDLH